jgi:2-hydroxychromene-2-carboxylate isomerase
LDLEEIKLYSDYKSPYAYLAFDPGFSLEEKYRVRVRWIPFQLRLKGKGERSVYSEYKVRYSYLDARRWANMRGGMVLCGPLKIYDTRPALIGGLFARKHSKFMEYSRFVFEAFFKRELEVDEPDAVAKVIVDLGMNEGRVPRISLWRGGTEIRSQFRGIRRRPDLWRTYLHLPQRAFLGQRPHSVVLSQTFEREHADV